MSFLSSSADEVRVLTGGENLFDLLYRRAEAAYPRAIWVEGFGSVKGASIVELVGDRHRETVREATLSAFSATVYAQGDKPEIRSVATLTWREKRTPQTLTGFLASAFAIHVTLRIREVEILSGAAALDVQNRPMSHANASPSKAARQATATVSKAMASNVQDEVDAKRGKVSSSPSAFVDDDIPIRSHRAPAAAKTKMQDSSRAVDDSGWVDLPNGFTPKDAPAAPAKESFGWGDVAAKVEASAQQEPQRTQKPASPAARPAQQSLLADVANTGDGWGDVAARSEELEASASMSARDLKKGEVLIHPTLGECTILNIVSESVVMLKPKRDRMRKVSLKPFAIHETSRRGFYELSKH